MPDRTASAPNEADRFARAREKQAVALLGDSARLIGALTAEGGEGRVARRPPSAGGALAPPGKRPSCR